MFRSFGHHCVLYVSVSLTAPSLHWPVITFGIFCIMGLFVLKCNAPADPLHVLTYPLPLHSSGYSPYPETSYSLVRFGVFTAVTLKNVVFWDVVPCRCCVNQRFGGMYRLYLQGNASRKAENPALEPFKAGSPPPPALGAGALQPTSVLEQGQESSHIVAARPMFEHQLRPQS
jgi:hypothetical protein